ncbi:MAG: diguanylate cyclase [Candidatus Dormibacteria bacterium]
MPPIQRSTRIWFAVGSALVIAAVGLAVSRSTPPAWVLQTEITLFALGAAYAIGAVIWIRRLISWANGSLVTAAINIALATTILAVVAPWLPEAMPLSFATLLSVVLAAILTRRPSWSLPLITTAAAITGLAVVWTRLRPAIGVEEFAVWAGMLAGVGVLIEVHRRLGRTETEVQLRHLAVTAAAAHALGAATDLSAIARAVLEAYRTAFPHLDWGGILLLREGRLRPLPLSLMPSGITETPAPGNAPAVELRPGDGLAGKAFETGKVQSWASGREARLAAHSSEHLRTYVDANVGTVRSALAVPLRVPGPHTIGVISLGSTTAEHQWSVSDLTLAHGLADVAAVAIQRGELTDEQRRQASTDHLTELPNRREFDRIVALRQPSERFSVLVADVDNLKMINDEYGHEAGDGVLRIVAKVLRHGLRSNDTVARIGGDEFAAFMPGIDMATASSIAERILEAMRGVNSPFGAARLSIGVADGDGATPVREVWERADAALYTAKQTGRNRVRASVHRGSPGSAAVRWSQIVGALVDDRTLESVYQPIVRISDRSVIGYEALARRPGHPEENVDGMFSAAQRLGFSRDLDWLARRAAVDGARSLPRGALLFINVGVLALVDPLHDIDQMFLLLNWAGRRPDDVVLELSEREAVTDRARLRAVLSSYRYHGFRFAIDDVGEGHSTIEVLATARPEFIKVAGTLSRGPGSTVDGNVAAIAALVTFASATGAMVIAEGLETDDEIELMADLGVTSGQGFALGRPAPLTRETLQPLAVTPD